MNIPTIAILFLCVVMASCSSQKMAATTTNNNEAASATTPLKEDTEKLLFQMTNANVAPTTGGATLEVKQN